MVGDKRLSQEFMKKIVSFLLVLTMLVGCGPKSKISKEEATSKFILQGEEITLPMKYDELLDKGWVIEDYKKFDTIPAKSYTTTWMKKDGNEIEVAIVNPTDKKTAKDLMVTQIGLGRSYKSDDYEFYGGVKLDDEFEKVKKGLDALPVLNINNQYGSASYGVRGKELEFNMSERGMVSNITLSNYGDWNRMDFKLYFASLDDKKDTKDTKDKKDSSSNKNEIGGFSKDDLDVSWITKSIETIKSEGEANRDKYPLSDLKPFKDPKLGIYKVEGKVSKLTMLSEKEVFVVEDSKGGYIVVSDAVIKELAPELKFEQGKKIVVYVAQIFATDETIPLKIGAAPVSILIEYEGKTYSIFDLAK